MAGTSAATRQRLLDLVTPVVTGAGYDVDGLQLSTVGRRVQVRLTVDADDGIDLDAVAEVTRLVSHVLDENDPLDSPFVLEVSSPGVDRPLREPRHWRRAAGRLVTTTADGAPLTGRVLGATDTAVEFDVDGSRRTVQLGALGPGRVQVEFSRPGGEDE